MHVLDANEIFWMTFYTYDRILQEWWTNWPDALALYVKLIKQTRIQQTNQTYSLDSFLQNGLGWGYKRLKNAKDILNKLWLMDNVVIRDNQGKVVWHYVRVNFLINEQNVRTNGITYNLSTTYSEPVVAENQNWLDEHKCLKNINTNALNTKKENTEFWENSEILDSQNNSLSINNLDLQEKEKNSAKKEKEITFEINMLISDIKNRCDELWVAYDKTKDRMFAKHILTAKEFWDFCDKIWQTRKEFAINVLVASVKINYWKWPLAWPMKIYQNYADLYNQAKSKIQKTITPTINVL